MEPQIQYARTEDGVNIAFWTLGYGTPFVLLPNLYSHLQLEWKTDIRRQLYERIASYARAVRYDHRGAGISQRGVGDFSLDARLLDLSAVIERLDAERVVLMGPFYSGAIAAAYAAKHPERVSELILWGAFAKGADYLNTPQVQTQLAVKDSDWEFFAESAAQFWFGWSGGDDARQAAAVIREGITAEELRATLQAFGKIDVTPLLNKVQAPTLVVHFREMPYPSMAEAQEFVSGIPNARLALFEGNAIMPAGTEADSSFRAVEEFLGVTPNEQATGSLRPRHGRSSDDATVSTVLFTDVVAHTEMMSRLGDERGREVLREHERITREVLATHSGTEVKTMGDGFMASFGSVTRAVECAVALQKAFADWNASDRATGRSPLQVRVGLNAGEPIEEDGDLFGATVILASRIAAKAEGGEILVADTVRGLCSGKGFLFSDRGGFVAKGFEEPVRVYEVRWGE